MVNEKSTFEYLGEDWVWSKKFNENVRIIKHQFLWGVKQFKIWIPSLNTTETVMASDILQTNNTDPHSKEFLIYISSAMRIIQAFSSEEYISPINSNIIPLPHQLYALTRAIKQKKTRLLLADEVGLGKTIEAGLILRELIMRKDIRRVLIVVPVGLVDQWLEEMRNHFGEEFVFISPSDLSIQTSRTESIWYHFDRVIVSIDSVKPIRKRKGWTKKDIESRNQIFDYLVKANWGLVIIDEAHKVAGTSKFVARHKLGKALALNTENILLLSATPHQGKTKAFLRLMSLIQPSIFNEEDKLIRSQVLDYTVRTEKTKAIDLSRKPLFKPRKSEIIAVEWKKHHAYQKQLYEKVSEYVRESYNRAIKEKKTYLSFLLILMQRLVSSSIQAIRVALEKRLEMLNRSEHVYSHVVDIEEEWWEIDSQEKLNNLLTVVLSEFLEEKREVKSLLELAKKCEMESTDAKFEVLLDLIFKLQRREGNLNLKFLIFTEFVSTQSMLKRMLESRGFNTVLINGSMNLLDRKQSQERFRDEVNILISTEAGGEGLNLQFCYIVINYDVPWNPMRIEQRIGRVDRIGQSKIVRAYNFLFRGTVEERVFEVLENKLNVVLHDLGFDKISDILDSGDAEKSFDNFYMESILNPENIEENLNDFVTKIESIAQEEKESFSIFKSNETIDVKQAKKIVSHPFPLWFRSMVLNFLNSHGGKVDETENGFNLTWNDGFKLSRMMFDSQNIQRNFSQLLMIDHDRIKRMYLHIPHFVFSQPIPMITIKELSNSIEGFWTLWKIQIRENGEIFTSSFATFFNKEGKLFIPTANRIWDLIIREEFTIQEDSTFIHNDVSLNIYQKIEEYCFQKYVISKHNLEKLAPEIIPVTVIFVGGN